MVQDNPFLRNDMGERKERELAATAYVQKRLSTLEKRFVAELVAHCDPNTVTTPAPASSLLNDLV